METKDTGIIKLDIVSAEQEIFSGEVLKLFVTGVVGELGIMPGHTPLMTKLAPGEVRVTLLDRQEEIFYISGGMLEVQPYHVTVLSDTAMRAADIDEAKALEAKRLAEEKLHQREGSQEYSQAIHELAMAAAQIRALMKVRKGRRQ